MAAATTTNSWLRAQRKSDLVELADKIGLKNAADWGACGRSYESFKKAELETALDEFIAQHSARLAGCADLTGYFNSRSKALGSPVKKEDPERGLRVVKRRANTKAPADDGTSESDDQQCGGLSSSALVQTPGRNLSLAAARIPLPASPADVAHAVDRSTVAMRKRVSSMYHDSGLPEASQAARETLSTVTSILFCVSAFELYFIRPEILASRYAFTVPALAALGTPDYPVYLPDMFLVLTASFWSPALTWALTAVVVPSLFGYFFNLGATAAQGPRTRTRARPAADPLTFSIVKALVSYVVYAQRVTFAGLLNETSIERLDSTVYGGHRGILVGAAITALVSVYDAVLRR